MGQPIQLQLNYFPYPHIFSTGSAVESHISVGFTYAKLVQDFTLIHEPKLSLQADLDFYSGIKLCMKLQSPDQLLTSVLLIYSNDLFFLIIFIIYSHSNVRSVYLQNVEKSYAKHLRSKITHKSAGRTFALNQKNNEMCNTIFAN